ncbi:MAG: WbqC family protein [Candidatus Pacebacteria bacterium]|nr:WbqC family protein [Candidatus Paceibacterota bacterium]
MKCSINQPTYLPWIGYFNLIYNSDVFVFLDHVQYEKNEWINRNKIKTPNGFLYLTVPIKTKGKSVQSILDAEIDRSKDFKRNHLKAIRINYNKARFFNEFYGIFEEAYEKEWTFINDLNIYLIKKMLEVFGINREIIRSSELSVSGAKTDLVINILKSVKADHYISNLGSKNYLNEDEFKKNNIKLEYHNYSLSHPQYPQMYGEFIPFLSIIDLLFNCGKEGTRYIINNNIIMTNYDG